MATAELYLLKTDDTTDLLSLLPFSLPEKMRTKALQYYKLNDRNNYIAARWILHEYFKANGIDFDFNDLLYTDKGKPYLRHNIDFNISHTRGMAGVLFGNTTVGLDIEAIRIIENIDEFSSVFTHDEISLIKKEGILSFFEHWTLKEAIMKWCGEGITDPLLLNATRRIKPDTAALHDQLFHVQSFIFDNAFYLTQAYLKADGIGDLSTYNYGIVEGNQLLFRETPIDVLTTLPALTTINQTAE
jgi:phosphopantetheine--protein transferase-like protein